LPASVQAPWSAQLGHSLEDIRCHVAPDLPRICGAEALAVGPDLYFASPDWAADRPEARERLAHEVAHAVQFARGGGPAPRAELGSVDSPFEREAERAAAALLAGEAVLNLTPDQEGVARRAVKVDPKKLTIKITTKPKVSRPLVNSAGNIGKAKFDSSEIEATADVYLNGSATDSINSYELGFAQVQSIETNWGYYRGQSNADGSLLVQRGKPPARANQTCRDVVDGNPVSAVWYNSADNGTSSSFAYPLMADFYDKPADTFPLVETNSLTGKKNFLREVQLEFHFCTVLLLKEPSGGFKQLAHFYWNTLWQSQFLPADFSSPNSTHWTVTQVRGGNSANTSKIFMGGTSDPRFKNLVTGAAATSCNAAFRAATANAATVGKGKRESKVWDNFDVRR